MPVAGQVSWQVRQEAVHDAILHVCRLVHRGCHLLADEREGENHRCYFSIRTNV